MLAIIAGITALRTAPRMSAVTASAASATTGARTGAAKAPPPANQSTPDEFSTFHHAKRDASGKVTSQIYLTPEFHQVHGQWQEIDSALAPHADPALPLSAEAALRPVRFGGSAARIVEVELDKGPVTMTAPSLAVGAPRAADGGVVYRNVATDTDLEYGVSNGSIKEQIVLRSANAPQQFTFHIDDPAGQLGAVRPEGGGYRFDKTIDGDVAVGIAAPFAYEEPRAGAATAAVPHDPASAHMTVTPARGGVDVTTSVDRGWLRGKTFPIVVDPTLTFNNENGTMFAGLDSYDPAGCQSSCVINPNWGLFAGNGGGSSPGGQPIRSFYQFDLTSIPLGSQVSSATLAQWLWGCVASEQNTYVCNQYNYTIELHPMTGSWGQSATWGQLSSLTSSSVMASLYQTAFSCSACGIWHSWDMTNSVQSWLNLASPNYGFSMKLQTEGSGRGGVAYPYHGPNDYQYPHPYLQVTYTPPSNSSSWGAANQCLACARSTNYGQPVNTDTGNFWHTFDDLRVPGRGDALEYARTYNSLGASTAGRLGYGWTDSYGLSASTDASGNVTIHQEMGATVVFTPAAGGGYRTSSDVLGATLVKNADGSLSFTRKDKTSLVFSSGGQLLREIDRNGYTTSLSYGSTGLLTSVTDAAGRSLTFTYDGSNRVTQVQDPGGRTVSYSYDAAGNLATATDVLGGVTHFAYDSSHLLDQMSDPMGRGVTNTYDVNGRVVTQTDTLNRVTRFSYGWGGTTVTDPRGFQIAYQYQNHSLVGMTKGVGTASQAAWSYTRDPATQEIASVTDPNGHKTSNTWDTSGNLLSTTDALGRHTTSTYNSFNEVTSSTDATGVTTTASYDGNGNRQSASRPLTATGQTATTSYTYGDTGHPGDVTAMTDPNGRTSQYSYDQYGNPTKRVDPLGDTTTYAYDVIGRMTSSVSPRGNATGASPSAFTTTLTYQADSRPLSVTDPLGHVTRYQYDGDGNLLSGTDANSHQTEYAYDADNEQITVTRADGTTLHSGYDADGNVTSQTDGLGRVTQYGYDPLDRQASVSDPLNRTTSFSYDGAGNLVQTIDPSYRGTQRAYDAANQLLSITYSNGYPPNVTGLTYDAAGRRTRMSDGTGTSTWSYDSLGRLTASANGAGSTISYGYDLAGQQTALTYPGGQVVHRQYDAAGRLQQVTDWLGNTTAMSHDADSNQTAETFPAATAVVDSFSYDTADRLMGITDVKTATTFASFGYSRNNDNQLTSTTPTGVTQPNEAYAYTAINQLSSVNGAGYTYDPADNLTSLASGASLSYDAANELTSESFASTSTALGYDAEGERSWVATPASGAATFYDYDQAGRLTYVDPPQWTAVAAGYDHTLALRSDGTVWAWGDNADGELGNGSRTASATPQLVLGLSGVTAIAAAGFHSMALRSDGTVWAWGDDADGELGNGTTAASTTPVQVQGLSGVTAIATGYGHGLALEGNRTVWAWGSNRQGQLGNATMSTRSATPVLVTGVAGASAIGAGDIHSLAVIGGSVWAWGDNSYGQLGNGQSPTTSGTPLPVPPGGQPVSTINTVTPLQVLGVASITAVAGGGRHSLALKSDGTVWAWGDNADGELGNGTTTTSSVPTEVAGFSGATSIAAGFYHSLAVDNWDRAWAWGGNPDGELGTGSTQSSSVPVQAAGPSWVKQLAGGASHTEAVAGPALWGWGRNTAGQLGDGDVLTSATPVMTGGWASYAYDGDGRRTSKATALGTTQFTWDVSEGLPLLLQDGANNYVYGEGGLPLEQIDAAGHVTYMHHDQLGSTRLLTDTSGNVTATYTYDAYGQVTGRTGTASTNLLYAGQYRDGETGLYYLRARFYDPMTAQFLSRDHAAALTRSPYGYVRGNPLNGMDPSGLIDCGPLSFVCDAGNDIKNQTESWAGDINQFGNTHVFGWCLSGSVVLGVVGGAGSACVEFNLHSFGITGTAGVGPALGLGISSGTGPLYSDAHSVRDLNGLFAYADLGGGVAPFSAGANGATGVDECGRPINVVNGWLGYGVGTPWINIGESNTWVWTP